MKTLSTAQFKYGVRKSKLMRKIKQEALKDYAEREALAYSQWQEKTIEREKQAFEKGRKEAVELKKAQIKAILDTGEINVKNAKREGFLECLKEIEKILLEDVECELLLTCRKKDFEELKKRVKL